MANRKYDYPGALLIFVLLMGFWVFLTNNLHWQELLTGFIFSVALTYVWAEITIGEHPRPTSFTLKQLFLLIFYFISLAWEVVLANIHVALVVLHRSCPVARPGDRA